MALVCVSASAGCLQIDLGKRPEGEGPALVPRFVYTVNSGSDNVSAFTIDLDTGILSQVTGSPFAAGDSPQDLAVHPEGGFIAQVHSGAASSVTVYAIDPDDGGLLALGVEKSVGSDPRALAFTPSGEFLYVANLGSNDVSGFQVDAGTGALTALNGGTPFGAGTDPSGIAVHPSGTWVYAVNSGSDSVSGYRVNAAGLLTELTAQGSPFATGRVPAALALVPDGDYLYVANSTDDSLTIFSVNANTGALTEIAGGSPFPTGSGPAGVDVDSGGRFLLLTNAGADDSVETLTIADASGQLTSSTGSLLEGGDDPVSGAIDPTGRFVYVANQGSNDVSGYLIDSPAGRLDPIGASTDTYPVGSAPAAIRIVALEE